MKNIYNAIIEKTLIGEIISFCIMVVVSYVIVVLIFITNMLYSLETSTLIGGKFDKRILFKKIRQTSLILFAALGLDILTFIAYMAFNVKGITNIPVLPYCTSIISIYICTNQLRNMIKKVKDIEEYKEITDMAISIIKNRDSIEDIKKEFNDFIDKKIKK